MSRSVAILGTLALALPVLGLAAAWVATPHVADPYPTAYAHGDDDFGLARGHLQGLGWPVQAAVASVALAPPRSLVVIARHDSPWSEPELAELQDHLNAGGSVWVAGTESLSSWLAGKGAAIGAARLLPASHVNGGQILLEGSVGGSLTAVVAHVPRALVLEQGSDWVTVLRAPAGVHLDLDGNGQVDQGDPPGPFPVGAMLALEAGGAIVVTGDDSLLTDKAWEVIGAANADFVKALVDEVAPDSIVWDESGQGWTPKEAGFAATIAGVEDARRAPTWTFVAFGGAFAALAAVLTVLSRPIRSLPPHRLLDAPQAPAETPDIAEVAWELLASRTGRPLAELTAAGAHAAVGLADDARLRRVLLRQGSPADEAHVLRIFTNQEPNP